MVWMVFIIVFYKNKCIKIGPPRMRSLAIKLVLFSMFVIPSFAQEQPTLQYSADRATIPTTKLNIQLSAPLREALDKGVSLHFDSHFGIKKSVWLFSYVEKQRTHQFILKRHALSNRYIVRRLDLEAPRIFRSIGEAVNYIAAQALILLESYDDLHNTHSMRLTLNRFDLPGPMRLNAFASSDWDIDTGWITWKSAN